MLDQLNLQNFKCFSERSLPFKPLTILAGTNASGKSSIIQAILLFHYTKELLCHPFAQKQDWNLIDINKVYGMQLGATRELFSHRRAGSAPGMKIEVSEDGEKIGFRYDIHKDNPLNLVLEENYVTSSEVLKRQWNLQYLNAERIGPRLPV